MALIKEYPVSFRSGEFANYWRIIQTNYSHLRDDATVTLGLYLDADARSGGFPVLERTFSVGGGWLDTQHAPGADVETDRDALLKPAYVRLLALAQAEAAKDPAEEYVDTELAWFADAGSS